MTSTALRIDDTSAEVLAALAAHVIEQVGADTVRAHLTPVTVRAPRPGRAQLGCRCGAVLDAADMRRLPPTRGDTVPVRPIVCPDCAEEERHA